MSAPRGEGRLVQELWRQFSTRLRGYLRRHTRNPADADDLVQEVFLRIHRQLPTLRDPVKLQGWIYRIARNALIDRLRTCRAPEAAPLDPGTVAAPVEPTGRDQIDLTPTVRQFVATLPPVYREVVERHPFQNESLAEVAAALGLTLTATKSHVRRGRLLLRAMLDRCCRFEFDRRGRVIAATPWAPRHCACEC